jgi:hypothetical protein
MEIHKGMAPPSLYIVTVYMLPVYEHVYSVCLCRHAGTGFMPVPIRQFRLHGFARYQKVYDTIHKSAEYCAD